MTASPGYMDCKKILSSVFWASEGTPMPVESPQLNLNCDLIFILFLFVWGFFPSSVLRGFGDLEAEWFF